MADMKTPAIVALTPTALETAEAVRRALGVAEIHGLAGRIVSCGVAFEDTAAHLRALFAEGRPIIAVFSVGALVRLLCEALEDKRTEPPVLAVSQDGASIVPVLGGHHGANRMARDIADALNAHAAVTAAGDLRFGVALDDPPAGWTLANPQGAKPVMADLLAGASARLEGDAPWIGRSGLPLGPDGGVRLTVTERMRTPGDRELIYRPRVLTVGVGCERGCDPAELVALVRQTLDGA